MRATACPGPTRAPLSPAWCVVTLRTRGVESPIESARIARGHVKPVTELSPDDYDALLIPLLVAAPAASGDAGNGHAISLQKKAGPPRLERLIFIKAPNTWRRFANPDAGASQLCF